MILKIQNFMSYEDLVFEIPDHGLVLFFGKSGSGKTSLMEAFNYALYGKTRRGAKISGVTGENSCVSVEELDRKKNRYSISRYRNHSEYKDLLLVRENNGQAVKIKQEELDEIIGVPHDLFMISNVVTSTDEHSCILDLKSGRADIFERYFGLNIFDPLEKKVAAGLKYTDSRLASVSNGLIELNARKETIAEWKDKKTRAVAQRWISSEQDKVNDINREIKYLNDLLEDPTPYVKLFERGEDASARIETLEKNIKDSRRLLAEQKKKALNITETKNDIVSKLQKAKSLSKCYACGQEIQQDNSVVSDLELSLKNVEKECDSTNALIDTVEKAIPLFEEDLEKAGTSLDFVRSEVDRYASEFNVSVADFDLVQAISSRIQSLKNDLKRAQRDLERSESHNQEVSKDVDQEIDTLGTKISSGQEDEAQLKKVKAGYEWFRSHLDIRNEHNVKRWKISGLINEYNQTVDHYVRAAYRNDIVGDVRLSFDMDLKELITVNGIPREYPLMSDGQKRRLNAASNFSFFRMKHRANKTIPVVWIDEALDKLDTAAQLAIMDDLQILAQSSTIFIISHNDAMKNSVDQVYSVTMKNSRSQIEKII